MVSGSLYLLLPLLLTHGHEHANGWVASQVLFLPGFLPASMLVENVAADWWQSALAAPFVIAAFVALTAWRPALSWLWAILAAGYSFVTVGRMLAILAV